MSQYALGLSLPAIFSDRNFVVSGCNQDAHQWIMSWPKWPAHGFILTGPKACGKSHLAHIWAQQSHASIIPAHELTESHLTDIAHHLVIEDIETITSQEVLLHAYNITRERNHSLLMTCHAPAQQLPFTLADLTSRLLSLPSAAIQTPDDLLIAAILRKQFADRQLKIDDDIIAYLLPRIDRSFIEIKNLIEALDHAALAQHKRLTIPFIRQYLALPSADAT
jgi:chromosomal replication initiation ATPase DnaA